MIAKPTQHVFAQLSGQDDNLGDSALRLAYLHALRGTGRHVHVYLGEATSDFAAGFAPASDLTVHRSRGTWVEAEAATARPVHAFNAGEINPRAGHFPVARRAAECARVLDAGGAVIFAGIGIKNVDRVQGVAFDPVMREASVMSWRDRGSRDGAGFGDVAPDWAYSEGTPVDDWAAATERPLIAVTMRFDRAWPGEDWLAAVQAFAAATGTRIVTVAQVARDAPRAVRLAQALGGEYLMPPSMRHDVLDVYVRDVYRRSLAVISDRAHGLIIGATEGAFPLGSGSDPHKISRLLAAVGLGDLVGGYEQFDGFAQSVETHLPTLAPAISSARAEIAALTTRIRAAMDAVA
ncbi:polysaccharide pyruvyl transferase family protein [Microbacterium sp. 1.5R]|uniref:polysaccharide pyruvyl transferase family protein n=1 Tax=Microbacterium sp. 1.5R TaxID=1916917 RepID=UPI0011A8F1C1|nr:polysaccharide pyruvyl transferase family protein [Microbacterium sp. 1.5R]